QRRRAAVVEVRRVLPQRPERRGPVHLGGAPSGVSRIGGNLAGGMQPGVRVGVGGSGVTGGALSLTVEYLLTSSGGGGIEGSRGRGRLGETQLIGLQVRQLALDLIRRVGHADVEPRLG